MKHLIIILLIAIVSTHAIAADVVITITIPSDKVADFSAAMEAYIPIPLVPDPDFVDDPNDPDDVPAMVPEMTQKKKLREIVWNLLFKIYKRGKDILKKQETVYDPNVIEVTVE